MSAARAWLGILAVSIAASLGATPCSAQSAYCRKTQARADGDTALLTWPRLNAAALRFPGAGNVDYGPTFGDGYQVRLGLSTSPIDIARAAQVQRAARADCDQHSAEVPLRELLLQGTDAAQLAALQAQFAYLSGRREQWRALLSRGDALLAAGLITATELQALRRLVMALERRLELVGGDVQELAGQKLTRPDAPLTQLIDRHLQRSLELEQALGAVRAFEPWNVRVSGGVIPIPGRTPEWFGALELSYSLGGSAHERAERARQSARAQELREASYEMAARVERLAAQARAKLAYARRQLTARGSELGLLRDSLRALDNSSIPAADYTRATLSAEKIMLESELVYYHGLVEGLRALLEGRS